MYRIITLSFLSFFLLCSFLPKIIAEKQEENMEIKIQSNAFKHEGMIPSKYTCDGEDISPQLSWGDVPEQTQSLALISDDPDAPMGTWVHWVVFNMPPDKTSLQENFPKDKKMQDGTIQGITSFKKNGYGGPCPPSGTHRYYFKLYALDKKLDLGPDAEKSDVLEALEGHILATGELIGKYSRK